MRRVRRQADGEVKLAPAAVVVGRRCEAETPSRQPAPCGRKRTACLLTLTVRAARRAQRAKLLVVVGGGGDEGGGVGKMR